jgi:acetyltransferase-like isoleucine patch superfamily enzyme
VGFWQQARLKWRLRGAGGRVEVADRASLIGRIRFTGTGLVRIGKGVRLDGSLSAIELSAGPGAELVLDEDVVIEAGVSIEAMKSVRIGARCNIGAFCKILDNDLHLVEGDRRVAPDSHPVLLEEDVTLGPRVILLPGAHLGRGTRVKPGVVFSHRTPAGAVVVGHPAKVQLPA